VAILHDFVRVALDGLGKKIANVKQTDPDADEVYLQKTVTWDPEDETDAGGMRVTDGRAHTQQRAEVSDDVTATWDDSTPDETTLVLDVTGYSVAIAVITVNGPFTDGQIRFEGSADGGTTWTAEPGIQPGTSGTESDLAAADYAGGWAQLRYNVSALTHLRWRLSTVLDAAGTDVVIVARATSGTSGLVLDPFAQTPLFAIQQGIGTTTDDEATVHGSLIAILKRVRTLLAGGLPAALGAGGGLKVDGSGTALPISAAALPLPPGAAIAAKQPTLGTAGSPAADVLTMQGHASGTPLPVDSELPSAVALTDNIANPTVPGVGAFGLLWDGANWDRAAGTIADGALVNLGANNDVTLADNAHVTFGAQADAKSTATDTTAISAMSVWKQISASVQAVASSVAGTLAISAASLPLPSGAATAAKQPALGTAGTPSSDVITVQGVTSGTVLPVSGQGAAASGVAGNPVRIGGRASNAVPTDVGADGDQTDLWTNRHGAPVGTQAPHVGLNGDPWSLVHEAAQYTTTQTSAVLVAGGASEKLVVTKVQIQVYGTTAGTLQLYFGTGAYSRGTNRAVFDGEFAPSATLKPGVVMDGPFISGTNGDDLLVTTSANMSVTISVWYYVVT
jgi:hypothetical protein